MSFPVALQSAAFYFLACTPCAKVRHRHQAKVKAKKEREEKARMEAEQPDMYHHPDPFHTNPHWQEEIAMGPSLPKKKKKSDAGSKNASQKGLTSSVGGMEGSEAPGATTNSSLATSNPGTSSGNHDNRSPSLGPIIGHHEGLSNTPTAVPDEGHVDDSLIKTVTACTNDDWNRKRYQREDEELWGHEPLARMGHNLMDALKHGASTVGRFVEVRVGLEKPVTEEDRYNFYTAPRNPPVNDYHPPVVSSKPAHKDGLKWMLQPPPPAKVMEGKVPVSRSGSLMSVGSRRTANTSEGAGLSRLVGEKAVEAKLRRGEASADGDALANRPRSRRAITGSTVRTRSQRTERTTGDRSARGSSDSEGSMDEISLTTSQRRRSRRPRSSAATPELDSDEEDEYISRSLSALSNTVVPAYAAPARPRLSTILSSDLAEQGSSMRSESNQAASPVPTPLKDTSNNSSSPKTEQSPATNNKEQQKQEQLSPNSQDSGLVMQN